ncbi:MAG TPA: hypothetical protein VG273_05595 [Bryobacteraceae bacterium]|nr:hypothetical protein [Bryobacteraceae bacterium]
MLRFASFLPFAFFCSAVFGQQAVVSNPFVAGRSAEPEIGTFTNNRFHHNLTGTEFSLPAGWIVTYQGKSSGGGEQVGFTFSSDSGQPLISAFVWMKPESRKPDQIPDQLRSAVEFKAGQRQAGMANYQMLRKTIERRAVAGQQALSVLAHYLEGAAPMTEYHTWAISGKTSVYVSARMREADFENLKVKVDEILDTFLIP